MDHARATDHCAVYGVIGDPVAHSLSPVIMNEAFAEAGINAIYAAFPVTAPELREVLTECRRYGVAGLNVTYPHKEAVLAAADRCSPRVALLGAANTLWFTPDGNLRAHNSDAPGTVRAIETFAGADCRGARAALFGAGGAARAAALGLAEAGAGRVTFLVRDPDRARSATRRLREAHPATGWEFCRMGAAGDRAAEAGALEACRGVVSAAEIVIQATPVGMTGVADDDAAAPVAGVADAPVAGAGHGPGEGRPATVVNPIGEIVGHEEGLHAGQVCLEMIYHPRVTPFLEAARRSGATTLDGLCLLIAQARESFSRWTGESFDLQRMYTHLEAYLEAHTEASSTP